jgi:uncharacterized protein (DUF1015 family)
VSAAPPVRQSREPLASALPVGYAVGVPSFEPFPGLRFSRTHISSLDDVVCPPYDVITDEERAKLKKRHPANIVRLEMPDRDGGDPYAGAAQLLDSWRDGGILHRDHDPALYGYRMSWVEPDGTQRRTVGVIGALRLESPDGEPWILRHEQTTPKAKSDRLSLLESTRTNLSPIWGLSPAKGLSELISIPTHPVEATTDGDGVVHELWPILDLDLIDDITEAVGSAPVLIADGHHRFETAVAFRDAERRSGPDADGDHELIMALVVELCDDELAVKAIHRLVSGLPDGFDLVDALGEWLELTPTEPPDATIEARMAAAGALAVVTPAGTWLGRPSEAMSSGAGHDLDASRLDVALAELPAHDLYFQHGWDLCTEAVATGQAQAAILLRPATVAQIEAIASGAHRMPPKTTFFWPKPLTGMVVRELID